MQPHSDFCQLHCYIVVVNAIDAVAGYLATEQHRPIQRILIGRIAQSFPCRRFQSVQLTGHALYGVGGQKRTYLRGRVVNGRH